VFVPRTPFQDGLMFVGKAKSLLFTHIGYGLLTYIKLGRIFLPGTNTLAYYEHLPITPVKRFITFGPGVCSIELFFATDEEAK